MAIKGPKGKMLELIGDNQVEMMYENALKVLDEVGVCVKSEPLLEVCSEAGCEISTKDKIVKINRQIVKKSLESAPGSITLHGRNPAKDVVCESDITNFVFGGTPNAHFIDLDTGEFRRPTLKDMEAVTTLADYFDNYAVMMTTAGGFDAPSGDEHLHELAVMLNHTKKPIIYPAPSSGMVKKAIQIATIVAGGEEEMRKRPMLAVYDEPTSPLGFSGANEHIIDLAQTGCPVVCGPAPIAGATAPMTLPGIATVGMAENLAAIVMTQAVKEGSPFIYGPHCGVMDMKTQRFCYGAPELHMGWVIQGQIAHYLGLPSFSQGGCNDSKCPDAQAGAEAAMSALLSAMCGINLIHNVATTAMGNAGCMEMIVICDDILGYVLRVLEEITVDEETLAFDVIQKMGPGGNYLGEMHTFNHFRENFEPKLFDRSAHETWVKDGRKELHEIAKERCKEILNTHRPEPLSKDANTKIAKILGTA